MHRVVESKIATQNVISNNKPATVFVTGLYFI